MTLKELYDNHPEWHNLNLVMYENCGTYRFVGEYARVYEGEYFDEDVENCIDGEGEKVVVFDAS